jgi:hypothetical protein
MDDLNKVKSREQEQNSECDSHASTSFVLTATLAVIGTGVSVSFPEVSTVADRIAVIQKAVKSGLMKLRPISGSSLLLGRMTAYGDNSAPRKEKSPRKPPRPQPPKPDK